MNRFAAVLFRTIVPRLPLLLVVIFAQTPWAFPWASRIHGDPAHEYVRRSVEDSQREQPGYDVNCTSEPEAHHPFPQIFGESQLGRGAILLHMLSVLYLAGCIGYICHAYFVPSLELICEIWKIPEDIAGATIMAAGTSLPELFAAVMGTFATQDDTGSGAIVGSAAFNIYAVFAICAFIAPKEGVKLSSFPILRDGFYWTVCMLVLILVVLDGVLHWWESLILSLMYIGYCLVMVYNTPISAFVLGFIDTRLSFLNYEEASNASSGNSTPLNPSSSPIHSGEEEESNGSATRYREEKETLSPRHAQYGTSDAQAEHIQEALKQKQSEPGEEEEEEDEEEEEEPFCCSDTGICSVFRMPDNWLMLTLWVFGLPFIALLCVTVPDCRKPGISRKLYAITFFMAGLWMALCCYILFWVVTVIGTVFGIPSLVMGYTLLAIGTSLPDAVASGIVSQHGYFNMAMGNISGSNTFEIVVCLGMVWFLKSLSNHFEPVLLDSRGFSIVASVLLLSFIVSLSAFAFYGWVMKRKTGLIALVIYIVSLILVTVTEYYANQKQPTCQSGPL